MSKKINLRADYYFFPLSIILFIFYAFFLIYFIFLCGRCMYCIDRIFRFSFIYIHKLINKKKESIRLTAEKGLLSISLAPAK